MVMLLVQAAQAEIRLRVPLSRCLPVQPGRLTHVLFHSQALFIQASQIHAGDGVALACRPVVIAGCLFIILWEDERIRLDSVFIAAV